MDTTPAPGGRTGTTPTWVPIRSLAPRHRARIAAHLERLAPEDRYLRFGYHASDSQIEHYVAAIDFERDELLGVFNRRLELVAMAHLAHADHTDPPSRAAEFGVSVLAPYRRRKLGARLFERAILQARNREVDTLVVHALAENTAMLQLARRAGATIERVGPQAQAVLRLPADSPASHVEAFWEQQTAELDYQWKRGAVEVDRLLDNVADMRRRLSGDEDSPS